jgi:hypothetical protein
MAFSFSIHFVIVEFLKQFIKRLSLLLGSHHCAFAGVHLSEESGHQRVTSWVIIAPSHDLLLLLFLPFSKRELKEVCGSSLLNCLFFKDIV